MLQIIRVKWEVIEAQIQMEERNVNSISNSICARASPRYRLAMTRGTSLCLASAETTGNRHFLISNYKFFSNLLIRCSSPDNLSTVCFPSGISLGCLETIFTTLTVMPQNKYFYLWGGFVMFHMKGESVPLKSLPRGVGLPNMPLSAC